MSFLYHFINTRRNFGSVQGHFLSQFVASLCEDDLIETKILSCVSQRYAVGTADQQSFKSVGTVELLSLQIVLVSEFISINSLFMLEVGFSAIKY